MCNQVELEDLKDGNEKSRARLAKVTDKSKELTIMMKKKE